jgi:peptidylprolyl isomerase
MRRATLLLLVLLVSALVACGDDEEPSGTDGTEATSMAEETGNAPGIPELSGEVERLDSGLGYIDESVGEGAQPQPGQQVTVHYTGWLTNGQQFDSSRGGRPFQFPIGAGAVIRGWDEGVATMKVGGKRRLIVPSELGYGARGFPPVIPANSTLIFDVELLSLQ